MNLSDLIDPSFSFRLLITFLHFLWQGSLVALLAILGDTLLSRASASRRYTLHVATLMIMMACVAVTFSKVASPVLSSSVATKLAPIAPIADGVAPGRNDLDPSDRPPASSQAMVAVEAPVSAALSAADMVDPPRIRPEQAPDDGDRWQQLQQYAPQITLLYFACSGMLLARLVRGTWVAHRLRQEVTPIGDDSLLAMLRRQAHQIGLRSLPRFAWCTKVSIPLVLGVFSPMILLPAAAATGLTQDQLRALITHELAHIRRYDLLVNLVQRLVESMLFFHPAVWYISRRISSEREQACDEMVLGTGCDRLRYADALVRMAEMSFSLRRLGTSAPPTSLAASGTSSSEFKRRVLKVLSVPTTSHLRPSRIAMLVIVALMIGGVLSTSRLSFHVLAEAVRGEDREAIRVVLKLNRQEFLLGESIAIEYEMTNQGTEEAPFGKGGSYPDLRINDGFRMSAVKIDEKGRPIGKPVGTWPMPQNFGGPVGGFKLKPNETYSTSLFVTRYLRFLEPGRYRLQVSNVDRLEEHPKSFYSSGETTLILKQPTAVEAFGVFERMKKAPRQAYDNNTMKFLPEAADFQAMIQPIYLPVLSEYAAKRDLDALQSLERMEQLESNKILVDVLNNALNRNDWQAARACFHHLKKCLPFPNWYNEPLGDYEKVNRDRVARTWKVEFAPVLTRLAKRLDVEVASLLRERKKKPLGADARDPEFLKVFRNGFFPQEHPQSLLIDIDYIYRCVGQPEDFADCLIAYAHSIELTKTLPLETNQYFRPRGSASGFGHTVMYMLRRGAKAPIQPTHPGEAAAFAIALRQQESFRPVGWQAELNKWFKSDSPYLAELILNHLPTPIPAPILDDLPTALAHEYIDLQIAACHVAKSHPRPAYREPLQKILDTAKDPYLRKYAVDAARANGIRAKYDADAPFVDAEKENAVLEISPPMGLESLKPDPKLKNLEPFQGNWAMDICDSEVKEFGTAQEVVRNWRWAIHGNEIKWARSSGEIWKLSFDIDATKSPKEIDLTFLDGPHKGEKCMGIYEWGGANQKMLLMSVQDPGAKVARPNSISMTGGGHTSLIFLQPVAPNETEKELASLQGTWRFEIIQTDGWPKPAGKGPDQFGQGDDRQWIVKGNEIQWLAPEGEEIKLTFTLDPTKAPKQIDATFLNGPHKGKKCTGIYERGGLKGVILWLCLNDPGTVAPRPTRVSYSSREGRTMIGLDKVD